jgi:trimeric autotransporter adhesin
MGLSALGAETTGNKSTAIGTGALASQNNTGDPDVFNTAVGFEAGAAITTGVQNTLIGGLAADALTTGIHNVALGYAALTTDTQGSASVAIGNEALSTQNFTSATDTYNTAVGDQAGKAVTTGAQTTPSLVVLQVIHLQLEAIT